MRTLLLIGFASLALAGGAGDAEARGGRIRFGWPRTRTPVPEIPRGATVSSPAPSLAIRSRGEGDGRPTYVVLPAPGQRPDAIEERAAGTATQARPERTTASESPSPIAPQTVAPQTVGPKTVAAAEPWCRSRIVVGTGAGFCMIN